MIGRFGAGFELFAKSFLAVVLVIVVIAFHVKGFYYATIYSMWYAVGWFPKGSGGISWNILMLVLHDVLFYSVCAIYAALGFVLFYKYFLFRYFLWFNVIAGLAVGVVAKYIYLENFDWDRTGVFGLFLFLALVNEFFRAKRRSLSDLEHKR